jgi:hypothetical protein
MSSELLGRVSLTVPNLGVNREGLRGGVVLNARTVGCDKIVIADCQENQFWPKTGNFAICRVFPFM